MWCLVHVYCLVVSIAHTRILGVGMVLHSTKILGGLNHVKSI